jgi:exosortase
VNRTPLDWILLAAIGLLFSIAFGFIGLGELSMDVGSWARRTEYWFFDSSGSSGGLVAAIAGWIAWRRTRLLSRTQDGAHPILTGAFFVASLCVFVWAESNEAFDLLFVVLGLMTACYSLQIAGLRGLRIMALPISILFLALPIPYPLNNEILWALQNWSAYGTDLVMGTLGVDLDRSGAHLGHGEISFLVVEGCSGLRSILTLTLIALVTRELVGGPSRRSWIPVVLAPPLALALNIVRIAAIVLGSSATDPGIATEHTSQGLLVLAVGTVILFYLAHRLAGKTFGRAAPEEATQDAAERSRFPSEMFTGMLLLMCVAKFVIEPWPRPDTRPVTIDFPERLVGWEAESLDLDYEFLGVLPRGEVEERSYRRSQPVDRLGHRPVDLLIAASPPDDPRSSPISTKLMLPGRDWQLEETAFVSSYVLGRDVAISVASAPTRRALLYSCSLHDDGFWRDSIRSLLALERGPFARERPRLMIHIATELGIEKDARVHAKKILDRFLYDFREPFRGL